MQTDLKKRGIYMRKLILMSLAMLAITGCSKKEADKDGDGKISAEEASKEMAQGGAMEMKPGEWEVKIDFSSIEGAGIPESAKAAIKEQIGKGATSKSCMTKEQTEKPGAGMFGSPENANCTFAKFERTGNKMTIDMTCKPSGMTLKSKMDGSFGADDYSMVMEQTIEGMPTGPITMKGTINGKRLGECPA
jgi:Protein of unknown function (DUF3617)